MSERKGTKALELWCKRLVKDCPEVQIENMTTSWRNGIAFCALVHHFRPDLIDMSKLKPENIYENNQLAYSVAEKHLGIPSLLDPEDMVENDVPDRLSVLTYLSQFYQRLGHTERRIFNLRRILKLYDRESCDLRRFNLKLTDFTNLAKDEIPLINTKVSESESKLSSRASTTESPAPLRFGKTGLDKCAACGLPVYLAQRLLVSHKLYHRRCFRCSKCSGHLNPKNFKIVEGSEFTCDSCKNEKTLTKYLNNNDQNQMGMLAFTDNLSEHQSVMNKQSVSPRHRPRPQSILEKINMFEKSIEKDTNIENKISSLTLKDTSSNIHKEVNNTSISQTETDSKHANESMIKDNLLNENIPDNLYKSNVNKFNFLQTQLSEDTRNDIKYKENLQNIGKPYYGNTMVTNVGSIQENTEKITSNGSNTEYSNVTDDNRIANNFSVSIEQPKSSEKSHEPVSLKEPLLSQEPLIAKEPTLTREPPLVIEPHLIIKPDLINEPALLEEQIFLEKLLLDETPFLEQPPLFDEPPLLENPPLEVEPLVDNPIEQETTICVPPRRKKQNAGKSLASLNKKEKETNLNQVKYPDHLNPFSDEEDESVQARISPKKISTNPFGSSDEEDDVVPPIHPQTKPPAVVITPIKRLIAVNPFWSDGEEPSSDDEDTHSKSSMYRSSMATSTPNLPESTRRKKAKAPPPPRSILSLETSRVQQPSTSMDDVASISSFSSYNSTLNSDQKSGDKSTPILKKKRTAPTPPDSLSAASFGGGSIEKGMNSFGCKSFASDCSRRAPKGPAPGLPLPERREVKLQMSPEDLQVQLDMLETQQLGLERQGVLIERMIRDKCEGDDADTVPQEEVEDLVIQLCELVNEKNDLFRKQTELMYIRRQQRLEQEQADIEHEIRIIQSRPAANRIDSDKAREEQLVTRLVEIVHMRDELVQQIEAERRRERQEDLAIAVSIANKRAQRNSESTSSSMKSEEVIPTSKKSKVKDKVKKQFKKAKHTLIAKKKDDSKESKEEKQSPKKKDNSKEGKEDKHSSKKKDGSKENIEEKQSTKIDKEKKPK